jgi:intein/homing endonuclease
LIEGRPCYQLSWKKRVAGTSIRFFDHYAEFYLKEANSIGYEGPVYNLRVQEDESYVTVGGVVHNCNTCPPLSSVPRS